MSRFYIPEEAVKGNRIFISGKEAHHILDVMRLKFLDEVVLFDGTGKEYTGIIKEADRKSLVVEITGTREIASKSFYKITLIQAIPKKDKMDYIAEKATELGVARIIPVTAGRTIPDWNDAKKQKITERWERIAQEAAKQCGRLDVPKVDPIMPVEEAFRGAGNSALKLIAALSDKAVKLKEVLKSGKGGSVAIAIGPEGDFTPDEIGTAIKAGFKLVNLGPRVLKSDTAGLAVLSILNYEYAD